MTILNDYTDGSRSRVASNVGLRSTSSNDISTSGARTSASDAGISGRNGV